MNWIPFNNQGCIHQVEVNSHKKPQVIFKHSTTCSISSMAKMRLESQWDIDNMDTYYLDLLSYKSLSNSIAEHFDVHHESPQLLLIVGGECVYDASHFDISVDELKESLAYAQRT